MSLSKVTPGKNAPDTFNVIIEIPMNADPVKYEVDKESGAIFVDRFMSTSMHYPTNYVIDFLNFDISNGFAMFICPLLNYIIL